MPKITRSSNRIWYPKKQKCLHRAGISVIKPSRLGRSCSYSENHQSTCTYLPSANDVTKSRCFIPIDRQANTNSVVFLFEFRSRLFSLARSLVLVMVLVAIRGIVRLIHKLLIELFQETPVMLLLVQQGERTLQAGILWQIRKIRP